MGSLQFQVLYIELNFNAKLPMLAFCIGETISFSIEKRSPSSAKNSGL
jgi:hypothetical protein